MKFRIVIDKEKDEQIVATVHEHCALIDEIEALICRHTDRIPGYAEDEIKMLSVSEIECVTVLDRKVIAIDGGGNQYRIQDRLRDLEEILPSYFIRINKSTLANEHRILRFDAVFSGGVDAVFQCGYREYGSRLCFAEIRRRY